jgi:hypothetical protein
MQQPSRATQFPYSVRAISIGTIYSCIIGVGTTYNLMVIHGSYMAIDFSAAAAVFPFFILTIVNNLTFLAAPTATLNSSELKTIYVMMIVSCSIPTMGLSAQLLPILTAPFYFATPDKWME